jgi:hypothetical protein
VGRTEELMGSAKPYAPALDGVVEITVKVGELAARIAFAAAVAVPKRVLQRQHIAVLGRQFGPLNKARLAVVEIERGRQRGDDELVAIGEATLMAAGVAADQDEAVPDYVTAEVIVLGRGVDPILSPLVSAELARRVAEVRDAFGGSAQLPRSA